ncbi:MAG: hypothetical protein KF912_02710 [Phycisphaeraceae bacterium]|nr:hypothetical protein [Phycisphaeraceae bacterium]
MTLNSYFDEFRQKTQPTDAQREIMTKEHIKLRTMLMQSPEFKDRVLSTFIQGSHRRATAILGNSDHPCDVDIVVVTDLSRSQFTAVQAHEMFRPFLERHYPGKYSPQNRSWCIEVHAEVKLDLVPTSEPDSLEIRESVKSAGLAGWSPESRSADEVILDAKDGAAWDKSKPLWIPDRELRTWEQTHPLALIAWTADKNKRCNGHFTHVVKALKWWKRECQVEPKYPKGYPLERIVAECCPDGISSMAEGITKTLELIASRFATDVMLYRTPNLPSVGVPEVNVLKRVQPNDFRLFHAKIQDAARQARVALDAQDYAESAKLWRALLGNKFPPPPQPTHDGGKPSSFTERTGATELSTQRYG